MTDIYSTDGILVQVFKTDGTLVWGEASTPVDPVDPVDPEPTAVAGYPYRQVATRNANNTGKLVGGYPYPNRGWTTRFRHYVAIESTNPRLVYNAAFQFGPSATDVTVGAAIEVAGVIYKATFSGQDRHTMNPGTMVVSDPIVGLTLPVGYMYVRTYQEVPGATDYMPGAPSVRFGTSRGEGASMNEGTDLTFPGSGNPALVNGSGAISLGLQAIVPAATTKPAFASVADSIGEGYGDDYSHDDDTKGGYIPRALVSQNLPYVNFSRGGDFAYDIISAARESWWLAGIEACTHAICGMGTNDIATARRTVAQVQADNIVLWKRLKAKGLKVAQHTCVPMTSSTDSFATVENQTLRPYSGVQQAWNAWLRDGAPMSGGAAAPIGSTALRAGEVGHPLIKVLDLAGEVETTPGSGIWKANMCIDGLHPNPAGYALMAAPLAAWAQTVTV